MTSSRECREPNPGQLGEKPKCYLCAVLLLVSLTRLPFLEFVFKAVLPHIWWLAAAVVVGPLAYAGSGTGCHWLGCDELEDPWKKIVRFETILELEISRLKKSLLVNILRVLYQQLSGTQGACVLMDIPRMYPWAYQLTYQWMIKCLEIWVIQQWRDWSLCSPSIV